MDTKEIISSLRALYVGVLHRDVDKAGLFREAADAIERLDRALYEQKEENRRLLRESALREPREAAPREAETASPGWISVKDRLPGRAGTYIIVDCYGNVMSRHFCKSHGKFSGYWHANGSAKYGNPTHWMPMPKPPKEET